jgi:predicted nuclease with TOPRIM domain
MMRDRHEIKRDETIEYLRSIADKATNSLRAANARIAALEAENKRLLKLADHNGEQFEKVIDKLRDMQEALEASETALAGFMRVRFYVAEGEDLEWVKVLADEARRLTALLKGKKP